MRLLLDTHIAIWSVTGEPILPTEWRNRIADPANDVAVSVASLWEIAIKAGLDARRRRDFTITVEAAAFAFDEVAFTLLPIGLRALEEVQRLPRQHGDPFDRLLVATAIGEGWQLVTRDRGLAAYGDRIMTI